MSTVSLLVAATGSRAFGENAAPRIFPAAEFLDSVGVDVHLGRRQTPYANIDGVLGFLNDIGIKHVRDDVIFASYVNRDHDFYKYVRTLVAAGCRFDLVCADPLNGYLFVPSRRLQDIFDWCDGGVEIFEGGNEPDLARKPNMNPAISAEHQRALFAAIKGNAKLRNVLVGSPSYIQKSVPLAEDISDAVDWVNIHAYPGMEHPETRGPGAIGGFIAASERFGGKKPVLVSETGYHTAVQTTSGHLPVSETIKTRYLPRLLLWNFMHGVRRTYIYELIDSSNNGPADKESHFGLVNFDLTPKSSYAAVKQLLALCGRPKRAVQVANTMQFGFSGDSQDLCTVAFARGDGTHLLFVWLGVASWDPAARQPRPAVMRKVQLTIAPDVRNVVAHQFQDDGSIVKTSLERAAAGFQVVASDQLTALEISP